MDLEEKKKIVDAFVTSIGGSTITDEEEPEIITTYIEMIDRDRFLTFIKTIFGDAVYIDQGDEEPEWGPNYTIDIIFE